MGEFLYVCRWTGYCGLSKIRACFCVLDLWPSPSVFTLTSLLVGGNTCLIGWF